MQYTEKLGLRLPEGTDNYDIADMNFNSNKLDFLGTVKSADKIEKYIVPEYEQVIEQKEFDIDIDMVKALSSPTALSKNAVVPQIDVNYENITFGLKPSLIIKREDSDLTINDSNTFFSWNSVNNYDSVTLLKILNTIEYNTANYINVLVANKKYVSFTFDFKIAVSGALNYRAGTSYIQTQIDGSNDETNWTAISGSNYIYNFQNYRYIRVRYYGSHSSYNGTADIYLLNFQNIVGTSVESVNINKFTIPNDLTELEDKQRVLIETPDNYEISEVYSNTLNDIEIDNLLMKKTIYELFYNENSDKFISTPKGAKVLYDITLTERVGEVLLPNLSKKIEDGKIYALIILGKTVQYQRDYNFCSSHITIPNIVGVTMFIFSKIDNNIGGIAIRSGSYSSSVNWEYSNITQYEGLKSETSTDTYHLEAGTRIIIKEVA